MPAKKPKRHGNAKIWLIIAAVITAVFVVPKAIDFLYLIGQGRENTTFESKDILSYWGSLLGGGATLISVIMTIKDNRIKAKEERAQAEEERKRQIRPNLASSYKHIYHNGFLEQNIKSEEFLIIEPKSDKYHVYSSAVPPNWLEYERSKDNTTNLFLSLQSMRKYLCIEYIVENIGNDAACNIKLTVDRIPALPDFSLGKLSSKIFKIVFDLETFISGEERDIEFIYDFSNIDGTATYHACESFTVFRDDDKSLSSKQRPENFLRTI